ncbi:MAG TPA: hypothetical protein VMH05_00750 [Bryobacteraceae bacterium]|nr:hypothetical protein [Bryobacteraceae bacterium]
MPFQIVPTGGVTDQATAALFLTPFTTAVKYAVWPEIRETDDGVTESEFWVALGVIARPPVAVPGINDIIALPVWKEVVDAMTTTVWGAAMTLGAT